MIFDPPSQLSPSRRQWLAAAALAAATPATAQFRVEITGVGLTQMPVAIPQLRGEEASPQKISQIVLADLERSGRFIGVDVAPAHVVRCPLHAPPGGPA